MNEFFRRFSLRSAEWMGSSWAFVLATLMVVLWAFSGPLFDYSDTWQLVINTSTTVLTFLAVFLIQNTQNRDAKAIHLKLDELIRTAEGARNAMVSLEEMPDEAIREVAEEMKQISEEEGDLAAIHAEEAASHAETAAEAAARAEEHAERAEKAS